MKDLVFLLL